MAWTTGTCTGHLELLDALKEFLTSDAGLVAAGQAWTCLADRTETTPTDSSGGPSSYNHRTVYFKGPGLAGEDEVYIGLQDWQWSGSDAYNLALQGYTGFREDSDFWGQPGAQPRAHSSTDKLNLALLLHNTELRYWFVANGRRVIIVVRVGSVYVCAYLGLMLPYCLASQWPYPLFVGGNARVLQLRYSTTNGNSNANFWANTSRYSPSSSGTYIWYAHASLWAGEWRPVGVGDFPGATTSDNPCVSYVHNHFSIYDYKSGKDIGMSTLFDTNIDGKKVICPIQLFGRDGMLGELDGMGKIVGTSIISEDVIADDGYDWLVVQNVFNEATSGYAAVALR